jgi:fibronectin type 3 domain-containing protein
VRRKPQGAQKAGKAWWFFVLPALFVVSSCAKVGDVKPPFVRIPEAVKDLSANQSGYTIVLTWTNPSHNIDLSDATDLAHVQILSGKEHFATVNATEAGKPQSYSFPATRDSGIARMFSVIVDTKRGKTSNASNTVEITPVDVPGKISNLQAIVDQRRITLSWDKPQEHPELADAYIVTRSDRPADPGSASDLHFEDTRYQKGMTVTYQVTAIRHMGDKIVTGTGAESKEVLILDKTPPQTPSGVDILESDNTAFITWEANAETDLIGYHVFRSDRMDGPFKLVSPGVIKPNQFSDPEYKPGMYYAVSAIDEDLNESSRSPAFRGP